MSTAFEICAAAYRQANLDQPLISFSANTDFPYNLAKDLANTVIQEMNRLGRYWFTETSLSLPYVPGSYQVNLTTMAVDPKGILRVRKEAATSPGELSPLNWRAFQQRYRRTTIPSGEPMGWSKFGSTLEMNCIPDRDYGLKLYFFKDIPSVVGDSDTVPLPVADEDVLREGVYAYLLNRIGRPDAAAAYAVYLGKVKSLLADMKQDTGIPTQMPAAF